MQHAYSTQDDRMEIDLVDSLTFADRNLFKSMLKELAESGLRKCVINLKRLKSIDSAGIGMFLIASEKSKELDCDLVLQDPQGQVKDMLEITSVNKVIRVEA